MQLAVSGTELEIEVPAGVSVVFGADQDRPEGEAATIVAARVEIDEVEVRAGDVTELLVSNQEVGSTVLRVPVQLPEGPYAEFDPSA